MDVAKKWIDWSDENLQQIAWAAMASYLLITPNEDLDYYKLLVSRIGSEINSQANNK